jgi:diguanylate cyclase (GGDEF)-like protein
MMFLPGTNLQQAQSVAERLRVAMSPLMSPLVSSEVTVSIGLTQIDPSEHLIDAMRRADSALYAAKKNGRNQIASN